MPVVREPTFARLFQDVFRIAFFAVIAATVVAAIWLPHRSAPPWLDGVGRVIAGLCGAIIAIGSLRLLVPRPRVGAHRVGRNAEYLRWLVSASLVEVTMHPLVRAPFWFLFSTRVLFLRVLGANVSWSVGIHSELIVRDPSLLTIGRGTQIEPGVAIEAALHGAGRVRVGSVLIGRDCLIGAHTILMPGVTIGHDTRIEPAAIIGEDAKVGVGVTIGEGVRLERDVDLGSYTTVGTGAIISEGVRIADRARVAAGAVVEPHTKIGEREVWEGAPARRVGPVRVA